MSGAAADMIQRSVCASYFAIVSLGSAQMRTSIVGTITLHVTRSFAMMSSAASGSKWFCSTIVAPSDIMIATNAGAAE